MTEEQQEEATKEEETVEETKTEEVAEEEKTVLGEESKEEAPAVPEKYDLKAPEESNISDEDLERIASQAKERGLTNDQAQKMVDDQVEFQKRSLDTFKQTTDNWLKESKEDAEIGGQNWDVSLSRAISVLDRFAPSDFRETLNVTGLGNHKGLITTLARIGKAMENDNVEGIGKEKTKADEKKGPQSFYSKSKMNP